MVFDTPCWIERENGFDAVDSTFGQHTGEKKMNPIFEGLCRVSGNAKVISRGDKGDEIDASRATIYLPAGSHGIKENDRIRVDLGQLWTGRIMPVSAQTQRFYTRLEVKWDGTPV